MRTRELKACGLPRCNVGTGSAITARMATKNTSAKASTKRSVEGEGSYTATRNYNQNLARAIADKPNMARGAEAARKAVEANGAELLAAEKRAKAGPRPASKGSTRGR